MSAFVLVFQSQPQLRPTELTATLLEYGFLDSGSWKQLVRMWPSGILRP